MTTADIFFVILSIWLVLPTMFFFFNDTATTEIYTLSLHDALPISAWTRASDHHAVSKLRRAVERRETPRLLTAAPHRGAADRPHAQSRNHHQAALMSPRRPAPRPSHQRGWPNGSDFAPVAPVHTNI